MLERLLNRSWIEWLEEGLLLLLITGALSVVVSMKVWADSFLLQFGVLVALIVGMVAWMLVERRVRERRPATRWERWIATQPKAERRNIGIAFVGATFIPLITVMLWTQEVSGDQVTPLDGAILVAVTVAVYPAWRVAVGRLKRTIDAYCAADIPPEDEGA